MKRPARMEQVKLLSMTVVLAVLVWAAADSLVNEAVSIGVTFEVIPATATSPSMIEIIEPEGGSFELEISGPRRIVEDVQSQAPLRARLRIPDRPTGSDVVPLNKESLKSELAEQFNEFARLTVVAVHPATLAIHVDHLIAKEVEIRLERLTLPYEVTPQLKRNSANVRMRESKYKELAPAGGPLQLDISTDVDRLFRERPAGESLAVPLALDTSSFGADAEFDPGTVEVTATVKAQRSTAEVAAVPVLLAVSFSNLEKPYRPVARDGSPMDIVAPAITVTGPTEDVARLVRGDTRAYGIIRLREVDLEELGATKLMTPEYHLPPRLELAEPPQPVEFELAETPLPETGD